MLKVLIVDDHELVRRGLRDLLAGRLGQVDLAEASDAPQATAALAREEWDLLLLDINLPGRSGLEVLEDARRLKPQLPVLMLTSYPEEQFAIRSLKLGASGYITKQSAADELVTAVQRVLAGGRFVTPSLAERLGAGLRGASPDAPHEALSQRELHVLQDVALGKSSKEIADGMGLSEKTVATYRARIAQKTGLKTNVEITRYALKRRLVD